MKKLVFFAGIFMFITNAKSQLTKGTWLVGGNISYSSLNQKSDLGGRTDVIIQAAGNAGYFFVNRLVGGLRPNILSERTKNNFSDTWSTNSSLGPFLRYYFLPEEQMVNLFVDGGYAYGIRKATGQSGISSNTFSIIGGTEIFLNSAVGLEFSVSYSTTKFNDGANSERNNLQVGLGLQFHLQKN